MSATEYQVARYTGNPLERDHHDNSFSGHFARFRSSAQAEKADQPFDDAERAAAVSRQEAERLANEAFARTPRSVALLAAKRQQEAAQAPAGTMAHAIGKAMAKAKSRDRK